MLAPEIKERLASAEEAAPAIAPELPVIGARPTLADMRRAVILAEVLRRPEFDRLPCDRDLP